MFWFEGSIAEAIQKSKIESKVFLVFISGNDESSKKMSEMYERLSNVLSGMQLVAIKLDANSDNCKLFSQLYPVIVIPSTYFIDKNGIAIEIIGGSVSSDEDLKNKIERVIENYNNEAKQTIVTSHNSPVVTQNLTNPTISEQIAHSNNNSDNKTPERSLSETKAELNQPSEETITEASSSVVREPSLEKKVDRANQLIEAIREKKNKEEEEKSKIEEIKRRKEMKDMQKAKKLREEKETSDAIKEREREKLEQKQARERVLAQIAADKEERKARMELNAGIKNEPNLTQNASTSTITNITSSDSSNSNKTRLQFRLPDGSTRNQEFLASDSLQTVREYLLSNISYRSFSLSTTFPRHVFVESEYNQTLRDLSLVPSSVLLVIPNANTSRLQAIASPSLFRQLIMSTFYPFMLIWGFVMRFLGYETVNTRAASQTESSENSEPPNRAVNRDPKKTFYDRDGNVARLRNRKDDDDNNTWNGNSTQQM